MHTAGRSGPLQKRITVRSNDPLTPELGLDIKGEVTVDVWVEPRAISFGQLGKGEKASRPFAINVADPATFKITSVILEDQSFKLVPQNAADGIGNYELSFDGKTELGPVNSKLVVSYTGPASAANPTGENRIEVVLRASIVSDLRYAKNLSFIKRDGAFAPQDLIFTHRDGKTVKILGVEGAAEHLKLSITEAEGARAVVKVEVTDPSKAYAQPLREKFVVKTDNVDEPQCVIQFTIAEAPARAGVRGPLERPDRSMKLERPMAPNQPEKLGNPRTIKVQPTPAPQ